MRPKNWETFQHYKDRRPPWIKLHRALIDDIDFHSLSGSDAKYLILIWIVASDDENGNLPQIKQLAFRLHLTTKEVEQLLSRLQHWFEGDASELLAERKQDAMPEESRGETERETESEKKRASKGTRFPDSYQPNQEHKELSKSLGVNLREEFPRFRDYWLAKAGKDAIKVDWDATLRNWIRTASQRTTGGSNGKYQDKYERTRSAADELCREFDAEENSGSIDGHGNGAGRHDEQGGASPLFAQVDEREPR